MTVALDPDAPLPPTWDLSDLYSGRDDPHIEADLRTAGEHAAELAGFEGALVRSRAEPGQLGLIIDQALSLYERTTDILWGLAAYASLAASTARDDAGWARFEADVRAKTTAVSAQMLFLSLELNRLELAEIEAALAGRADAARWRPWLRRVRLGRAHELSADMERLIADRSPAVANWSRLYDDTLAKLTAEVEGEALTLPEALNRLSDPAPARREAAAEALAGALAARMPTLALCWNTLALEKAVEERWRRYPDPAAARHLANEVDGQAVEAMVEAVGEGFAATSHRYYALKAQALGKPRLDYWDRNAPLSEAAPRAYGWGEAKSVVLDSFAGLAPAFADRARTFLERPWIDALPRPGKASGAFSHPVTSRKHPYVLLNFMGERRDVLTLAHELGHAVHQTLAAPLGTLLADTPLTLAETASIFGEGLVFERLLAQAEGEERRVLLAGRIEDGLNTVTRQIAFHRFETGFHAIRAEREVGTEEIGALWLRAMGESLGPAVRLNPGFEHYWAYVSHFVHSPFYVYAYAFGDLLVSALMEKRREDPLEFAPRYEALLSAGGTKTYVEALASFGLDPREKSFWAAGMKRLEGLVDAFEALG